MFNNDDLIGFEFLISETLDSINLSSLEFNKKDKIFDSLSKVMSALLITT